MSSTGIDKVLLLCKNPGANLVLEEFIRKSLKHPHQITWSDLHTEGRRLVKKGDFGLLIVSSHIDDKDAFSVCKLATSHPTACLLYIADETNLSKKEEKDAQAAILDIGAAILIKPLKQSAFAAAINSADMAHIRLCALKKRMDDDKVVNRAKLILIQTLGFSEEEAHKHIERQAMNSGRTRADVAYEIVKTYE
ncbi:MAG: ANTAR domain-containing protein [Clostridiales bacterium]|nr:ANTAR domain-containing protein [Clostridiales bacterium]